MSKASACWFIKNGEKLIQCSKDDFDKAIAQGKSVKYRGYANKRRERIADKLEASRMNFLAKSDLQPKFRATLTNPTKVIEVQIIEVRDPDYWMRESKLQNYKPKPESKEQTSTTGKRE